MVSSIKEEYWHMKKLDKICKLKKIRSKVLLKVLMCSKLSTDTLGMSTPTTARRPVKFQGEIAKSTW